MRVGHKFRDLHGGLCHVRALVDGRIVYRCWSRHKKRWFYHVISVYEYDLWKKRWS
jgi:hypothetical protein